MYARMRTEIESMYVRMWTEIESMYIRMWTEIEFMYARKRFYAPQDQEFNPIGSPPTKKEWLLHWLG